MTQDSAARQAALDPAKSFIVQAPAGSGKTGLLVYRMLALLATVEQPQQVLAVTFTRKATAEMRARMLELLNAAQQSRSSDIDFEQQGIDLATAVLQKDRQYNWQLLNAPHQLQILTIDAFCAKLTASMPWLSRLGDRPRTTDQADVHYAAAVEQLLAELLDEQSALSRHLQTVMLELDFNYNKARLLFSSMLARRDQWLRHLLQDDLLDMRQSLEAAWEQIVSSQLELLTQIIPQQTLSRLCSLAADAASKIRVKDGQLSPLAAFENWSDEKVLTNEHGRALCFLLLTKDAFRKKVDIRQGFESGTEQKDKIGSLLAEFADDAELLQTLVDVRDLPTPNFSDADWAQLTALDAVLKSLAALLQLRFRAVGECDHSEVTQRANLALRELNNPTDLGLRMDYHLQHILVDEFQDTSHGQIELLKKLTSGWNIGDGKTLFLVGDPMQSIYRFREADVSLFLQVADNRHTKIFNNILIEPIRLTENFRSSATLVNWFNETFKRSFPKRNDVLTGAITYAPASSQKETIKQSVECLLAHDSMQESQLLVEQILAAIADLPSDSDKVAVLVRSRSALTALLPALQQAGIVYAGVDIQPLRELQAVIDVLALCKAICREDDRVAWLALLRGPWVGLSLSEIRQLIGSPILSQEQTPKIIWQRLQEADLSTLTSDSLARLNRFSQIMQQVLQQRQQVSLGSLTRWAWLSLGGADTLFGAARDDIEVVFALIEDLQRGGDLASMNELDKALNGLFAQPNTGDAKVVVSTMHKSKGLQYHTVILPSLSRSARSSDKEVLMWAEYQNTVGESKLLLAPFRLQNQTGSHYDYLRQLESKRASNEVIRLMYVACTRAEKKLVLLTCATLNEDSGEIRAPNKTSLLATVWSALEARFDFVRPAATDLVEEQALDQTLSRLTLAYQPKFRAPINWVVTQQINAQPSPSEQENEFDWATQVATGVGILLHDWLQYNGSKVFDADVDAATVRRWRAELMALRVPDDRIEFAVARMQKAVHNIQVDTEAHFLFKDYAIAQNEYAVSAYERGIVNKYRIDRTFIDDDGVRWIVDYKSTDTNNQDVAQFVDEQVRLRHHSQLEKYGALMHEIDRSTEYGERPIKLAVYFPLLKQIRIWDYQQSMR